LKAATQKFGDFQQPERTCNACPLVLHFLNDMIEYKIKGNNMRIIAGEAKGRKLTTPKNQDVRPTGDRVKESIFNLISPYVEGAIVVDLFSGTGNLGLEAISRGAEKVFFVDSSFSSITTIKRNINVTGFSNQSYVIHSHYEKALKNMTEKADIFLIDPPYNKGYVMDCIEKISSYDVISDGGILMIEHSNEEKVYEKFGNVELIKRKRYGDTTISILRYRKE